MVNKSGDTDRLTDLDGGPAETKDAVLDLLYEGLHKNPDAPAILSLYQSSDHLSSLCSDLKASLESKDHLEWSYKQLDIASTRLAQELKKYRSQDKCTIMTMLGNSIEHILLFWTAAKLRATIAPVDFRLLEPQREEDLQYHLSQLKPGMLFCSQVNDYISDATSEVPIRVVCGEGKSPNLPQYWLNMSELASKASSQSKGLQPLDYTKRNSRGAEPAVILWTSGTSSRPKGVIHTPRNISASTNYYQYGRRFDKDSRLILTSPNFRAICNNISVCAWRAGAVVIIPGPAYTSDTVADAINSQRGTHVGLVPSQVRALAAHQKTRQADFSSMKWVGVGGDVVTRDIVDLAMEICPSAFVAGIYGMTENSGVFSWSDTDTHVTDLEGGVVGVGRIMPGTRARICRHGTGEVVRRGETGDLWLSGLAVLPNYLHNEREEVFRESDGARWLITGDTAIVDGEGILYVLARFKDVITRSGVQIAPAALETCLRKQTGVLDCHVFGIPDPTHGELPAAIIKMEPGSSIDKQHLIDLVLTKLGPESELKRIWTLQDLRLPEFPVNATGKVSKNDLKALVKGLD